MYNLKRITERFDNDPTFHSLVDMLRNFAVDQGYSAQELREACFLVMMEQERDRYGIKRLPDGNVEIIDYRQRMEMASALKSCGIELNKID